MNPANAYALAIAATVAAASSGIVIHGNGGSESRDSAYAIHERCAWFHFEYDRERCFEILTKRMKGNP
jgi:hypothetical protein